MATLHRNFSVRMQIRIHVTAPFRGKVCGLIGCKVVECLYNEERKGTVFNCREPVRRTHVNFAHLNIHMCYRNCIHWYLSRDVVSKYSKMLSFPSFNQLVLFWHSFNTKLTIISSSTKDSLVL